MDEAESLVMIGTLVGRLQSRAKTAAALQAVSAGLAALSAATALGALARAPEAGLMAGVAAGALVAAAGLVRSRATWTPLAVAGTIEARVPGLDNLVVTAVELTLARTRGSERMRVEVERQAAVRADGIRPRSVAPLSRAAMLCTAIAAGTAVLLWSALAPDGSSVVGPRGGETPDTISRLRLVITPPPYLQEPSRTYDDPQQISVPAGTLVRLEAETAAGLAWVDDPSVGTRTMTDGGGGAFSVEWSPTGSGTVAVVAGRSSGIPGPARLLAITVVPDQAPHVRILAPGRDLGLATPDHVIDVELEADDSEGLRAIELRFVRMSGSGEAFGFTEGRVALSVEHVSPRQWRARAGWNLGAAGLEDGDSVVYRAAVLDSNPAAEWTFSESFTIDIGRRLEFAGAGSAVPDEDRRYAISQQMVIVKTEQLQAERRRFSAGEWTEETRLVAMEQRMVRSEVVFLSGGEIQDEVAEAEHSHELQEGRLENAGRAEMLRALNDMSRAEARLNAGDTTGALVFERSALAALQRAFDRRRYFLRTLPERSRIDPGRRLTGDRRDARSSARTATSAGADPLAVERALMAALADVAEVGDAPPPSVAARLASLDPADGTWRAAAAALISAATADQRRTAATEAMNLVAARARTRLAPAAGRPGRPADEWTGWWAEELRAERPR